MLAEYKEKLVFYFGEITRFTDPRGNGGSLSMEAWVEVCKG